MAIIKQPYMKCAYHRNAEAIGVCNYCGRAVCYNCYAKFRKKTYCKHCYEELFSGENKPSGKPIVGGVLGIISGISAVTLIGPVLFHFLLIGLGYGGLWKTSGEFETNSIWYGNMVPIVWCAMGLFTMLFSKYALDRRNYWMAVAGGVLATFSMPLLGIPALILIAKSKKEFRDILAANS